MNRKGFLRTMIGVGVASMLPKTMLDDIDKLDEGTLPVEAPMVEPTKFTSNVSGVWAATGYNVNIVWEEGLIEVTTKDSGEFREFIRGRKDYKII